MQQPPAQGLSIMRVSLFTSEVSASAWPGGCASVLGRWLNTQMKPKATSRFLASLLSAVILPCLLPGQTIGIRMDSSEIRIDVEAISTEQVWLRESADLASWTNLVGTLANSSH